MKLDLRSDDPGADLAWCERWTIIYTADYNLPALEKTNISARGNKDPGNRPLDEYIESRAPAERYLPVITINGHSDPHYPSSTSK